MNFIKGTNFLLVDLGDTAPTRFVIHANGHAGPHPFQKTVARLDGEDENDFWGRTLLAIRQMSVKVDPDGPFTTSHGGVVTCSYSDEVRDWAEEDDKFNLVALARHWTHSPGQPHRLRRGGMNLLRMFVANGHAEAI